MLHRNIVIIRHHGDGVIAIVKIGDGHRARLWQQCVAVCCSVLQYVAYVQCVTRCCNVLQYVIVCCSGLQCATVC